jgi:hypothetical protein
MKVIVTTTVNPVTEAIERFDSLAGWHLIVIGDRKTPEPYVLSEGTYISPGEQEKYDKKLSDVIGWNCIQRRNFGLLWAHDMGAEIVAVVDDDNIPFDDWGTGLMVGKEVEVNFYETDLSAFDPVGATNESAIWHRGYPLQLLAKRDYSKKSKRTLKPDIQADFWNGEPDVDAVCRMEHAPDCYFDESCFPIASNKMSPFNSQNTFLSGRVLKDYFLFPHIGRMDDIWASYYVQARGYKVVYGKPSVYQDRNEHDPVRDMKQEYLGYENNLNIVNALAIDSEKINDYLPEQSIRAFSLYRRHFENAQET